MARALKNILQKKSSKTHSGMVDKINQKRKRVQERDPTCFTDGGYEIREVLFQCVI